jgi:hypothetical protein
MQHGRSAGETLGSQKSSQLDFPTEGSCLQPAGIFTQGHDSDFNFYQALCSTFSLRGAVLQPSLTDWHSGWRIAQGFALDQFSGECDAVQP